MSVYKIKFSILLHIDLWSHSFLSSHIPSFHDSTEKSAHDCGLKLLFENIPMLMLCHGMIMWWLCSQHRCELTDVKKHDILAVRRISMDSKINFRGWNKFILKIDTESCSRIIHISNGLEENSQVQRSNLCDKIKRRCLPRCLKGGWLGFSEAIERARFSARTRPFSSTYGLLDIFWMSYSVEAESLLFPGARLSVFKAWLCIFFVNRCLGLRIV